MNSLIIKGSQQKSNFNNTILPSSEKVNNKNSVKDSEGKMLTEQQAEYFKNSKVRDADGNLLVVYHGTDAEFNVFDISRGRPDMDIQGAFFSPDKADAEGYGAAVKPYYINLTNPADFDTAFSVFKKLRGEDNAGVKTREELIRLGYDGVNNGDEFIAFYPEQIKLTSNEKPTSDVDVRFSNRDTTFSKALTADEWKKYNNAITRGVDAGLRINDRSMLVECEKGDYSYKLVIYDNEFEDKPIKAIYGIAKSNKPTTNNNFDEKTIAEYITELEDRDYDNKRVLERLLKSVSKNVGRVLGRYSGGSNGFVRYGREISQSRGNPQNQSDRGGISKSDTQSVKFSERGTSLTASEENEVGKALYTLNKYAKK